MEQQRKEERNFSERVADSLGSIRQQVRAILAEEPQTRGNDSILVIRWLERFKGVETMRDLKTLAVNGGISFESIRRERQMIQRGGEFLPDDMTVRKRKRLEETYRDVHKEDRADA